MAVPLARLTETLLADPATSWSMGATGAVAEFLRDADEAVMEATGVVVTGRGGIALTLPASSRPLAYEVPAGPDLHWTQAIAWCVPQAEARRACRTVLTELGPDPEALRPQDRDAVLVDLGIGTPTVDACVRTADPDLLAVLRANEGESLFGSPAAAALVAHGPHRVFLTACGRVEVFTPIPPPDGRSPLGPHTHLLPHLIGRPHPRTVPVPHGLVPVAHAYPAHPRADHLGRPHPFDAERLVAWEALLRLCGDPDLVALKSSTQEAVRTGHRPPSRPLTAPGRAALAVALRQLACTDGPTPAAWRGHRAPTDLHEPAGDPNAG